MNQPGPDCSLKHGATNADRSEESTTNKAGIVIVGGGQAGCSLAIKLRGLGYEGPLTIVGDEPYLPYQRPPLSKAYLLGDMPREKLAIRPQRYFDERDIEVLTGVRATAIDREARTVSFNAASPLHWHDLVLATGSIPRRLPASLGGELEGVYTVRGIGCIDQVREEFVAGRKLLVVGGGYIGLEVAAVASKLGLHVTLIEAAPRILQRVAAEQTADYFRCMHQDHGVTILENTALERLEGEPRVSGARLRDGALIEADFVVLGIGIEPDTRLAESAGLSMDNGIMTDSHGRCSAEGALAEGIWAVGDCASFPHADNSRLRLESVGHAIDHAELVAANLMGEEKTYTAKPWFWSDQFGAKLQIAGLNTGYDSVVTRDMPESGISFWYYKGDTLLAVDAINDARSYMFSRRLIEAGLSPEKALVENPETDLKSLLK